MYKYVRVCVYNRQRSPKMEGIISMISKFFYYMDAQKIQKYLQCWKLL